MRSDFQVHVFIAVKYKYGGTKIPIATKNTEKPKINVPAAPSDTNTRIEIFIW